MPPRTSSLNKPVSKHSLLPASQSKPIAGGDTTSGYYPPPQQYPPAHLQPQHSQHSSRPKSFYGQSLKPIDHRMNPMTNRVYQNAPSNMYQQQDISGPSEYHGHGRQGITNDLGSQRLQYQMMQMPGGQTSDQLPPNNSVYLQNNKSGWTNMVQQQLQLSGQDAYGSYPGPNGQRSGTPHGLTPMELPPPPRQFSVASNSMSIGVQKGAEKATDFSNRDKELNGGIDSDATVSTRTEYSLESLKSEDHIRGKLSNDNGAGFVDPRNTRDNNMVQQQKQYHKISDGYQPQTTIADPRMMYQIQFMSNPSNGGMPFPQQQRYMYPGAPTSQYPVVNLSPYGQPQYAYPSSFYPAAQSQFQIQQTQMGKQQYGQQQGGMPMMYYMAPRGPPDETGGSNNRGKPDTVG